MYLAIYKKKNKMYFNVVKHLTEVLHITNEKMETVTLSYRNKLYSYKFDGWDDLKKLRPVLERWNLRYIILRNTFREVTQVKLVIMLMNNPLIDVVIGEKSVLTEEVPANEVSSQMYEVFNMDDVKNAENEFGCFKAEDFPDIF